MAMRIMAVLVLLLLCSCDQPNGPNGPLAVKWTWEGVSIYLYALIGTTIVVMTCVNIFRKWDAKK